MTTDEGKEIHGSTKKVKKRKADNNANIVTDEPNNKEVNNDDKSLREPKKKKRKKEKSDCKNGDMKTQNHEEVCEEIPPTLSKKKKKKKKREDPEADVDDLEDAVHAPESAGKKKKKKKDKHKHDKDKDCSEPERDGEKCNVDVVEAQQFVEEPCRKKKSKYKHKDGEKSEESSHKKKHKIKHDCTTTPVELDTNTDIECQPSESSSNNCKKKKKKKRKYEDDDVEQTEDGLSVHDSQVDGKKKKKKKTKKHESKHIADHNTMVDNSIVSNGLLHTSQEVDHDEDTPKLKKKKTHIGTDTDDSNKSYNSLPFDYNSIDNRQCKELTKSQSLDNHNEGTGQNQGVASLDAKSGQWGTASFENKEREQKFLRLLGGFKKGGSTASKPLFGKLGKLGGGCALNREEEASLNVKLETEFDRALSFKLSKKKSGGLGFQAPPGEGKTFFIDKTSSKSIKFNDSD